MISFQEMNRSRKCGLLANTKHCKANVLYPFK